MLIHRELKKEENRINFGKKISEESIVLLKNENGILPIKDEKIAVFGRVQVNTMCVAGHEESLIESLKNGGVNYDAALASIYKNWCEKAVVRQYGEWTGGASYDEMPLDEDTVKASAQSGAEKAIIVIGRKSAENFDMNNVKGEYLLSDEEALMVNLVCRYFKNVILLLNIGCNIDLEFTEKYNFSAILYMVPGGAKSCEALTDILCGRVCPSGKLTSTLARHYSDYPSAEFFGRHGGGTVQDYFEDIFVGYRYFDTFEKSADVLYPFGFGLSYTEFKTDITEFKVLEDKISLNLRITNIGNMAGKDVIQLYFSAPGMKEGALLSKPMRQLCDFGKTKLLTPGESEEINLTAKTDSIVSFDDTGVLGTAHAWVVEKGVYRFYISDNGKDFTNAGDYTEEQTRIIEKCHPIKTTLAKRLLANGEYEQLPVAPFNPQKPIRLSALETIGIPVNHFYNCSKSISDLSELMIGESVEFSLYAASGGAHFLNFGADIFDKISITVNGVQVQETAKTENGCIVILPIAPADLVITVKEKLPSVKAFSFKKLDNTVNINPCGETVLSASDIYECSFGAIIENYEETNGDTGCCITNLYSSGTYFLFKTNVKEAGKYDLTILYSSVYEEKKMEHTFVMFVSNIVQPLIPQMLQTTCKEDEPKHFVPTQKSTVYLPAGDVYIKIAAEDTPVPDVSKLVLVRNENGIIEGEISNEHIIEKNIENKKNHTGYLEDEAAEPIGIQLKEVYKNRKLMSEFLEQLSNRELATLVSGTSKNITETGDVGCNHPLPQRGVPAFQTADGPNGLRQKFRKPIAYPSMCAVASTFNKDYFCIIGEIMGEECLKYSVDMLLGPSINIFRHPAGGRNCQYCSEDPYLTGIVATEYIKGLQSRGVAAVLKHYAANSTEFERLKSNSRISERALREIYIKAFEMAVKNASPYMIMSSYNHINDTKVCEDYDLITVIPREEWHWDGAFVTDWWNDSSHVAEVAAGHDLKMATGDIDGVTEALDNGTLKREQVKICAERVLNALMKTAKAKRLFEE
ncbi:MAG: glycoside hydrolase family 3 protein [Clostridiales bacterium]|nr:glycoside hydrolase family 3 protein [Candidatus Equinaster intestinalis]